MNCISCFEWGTLFCVAFHFFPQYVCDIMLTKVKWVFFCFVHLKWCQKMIKIFFVFFLAENKREILCVGLCLHMTCVCKIKIRCVVFFLWNETGKWPFLCLHNNKYIIQLIKGWGVRQDVYSDILTGIVFICFVCFFVFITWVSRQRVSPWNVCDQFRVQLIVLNRGIPFQEILSAKNI